MDELVKVLITGEPDKAAPALKLFLEEYTSVFKFSELTSNRRKELWGALSSYVKNPKCSDLHADCLSTIRILSRDKTDLNEVVSESLLSSITSLAGINVDLDYTDPHTYAVALEALKSLCNLIYNSQVVAAFSCKNGTIEGITSRLHTFRDAKIPTDITFFDVKILFLITALCSETRPKLKEELHGLTYLIESLEVVLQQSTDYGHNVDKLITEEKVVTLTLKNVDLICEILKVLFNLTLRDSSVPADEEEEAHYKRLVAMLRDFLVAGVDCGAKRTELTNHVVNLLTNMPSSCFSGLYTTLPTGGEIEPQSRFAEYDMYAVNAMLSFLKGQFSEELTVSSQYESLSPVLTTLLKVAVSERPIRKYLRAQILPPLKDVHSRPEQGNTLRNCMCRLLTTPITQVRDLAAELLFVLCKENVNRMIKYTGYGNAAGLFASRGLLGGGKQVDVSGYSSDSGDSDTEEYKQFKHGINPVVGCYEPPHPNPTAHMTEEQKEHEAMKLVELMDNLTRMGTVKPCRIGEDGKPEPVEHVLQLQEGLISQQQHLDEDSD